MADLGSIGRNSGYRVFTNYDFTPTSRMGICSVWTPQSRMTPGTQDFIEGSPSQPSLRMDSKGCFKFAWPVDTRQRTIFVDVKQAVNVSPRPRLKLCANPLVGVVVTTNDAASGTGWVTCSITFTPTTVGYIEIVLESLYNCQLGGAPCYWDNFREVLV